MKSLLRLAAVLLALLALPATAFASAKALCTQSETVIIGTQSGNCKTGEVTVIGKTQVEVLEHMTYEAVGVGGKPTVTVKGANFRLEAATAGDKTGNFVIDAAPGVLEATESVDIGSENSIKGNVSSNFVFGQKNKLETVNPIFTFVVGQENVASQQREVVLGGFDNKATGAYASILGGEHNKGVGQSSVIVGGSANETGGLFDSVVAAGKENKTSASYSSVFGGKLKSATVEFESVL